MTEADAQRLIHVLGFAGSPRRARQELIPAGMTVEVFGVAAVPYVDQGVGHGKDEGGIARRIPAGTAGAAPGTA